MHIKERVLSPFLLFCFTSVILQQIPLMKFLIPILVLLAICCTSLSALAQGADDIVIPKKNRVLIGADDAGILIFRKDSIPVGAKKIGSVKEINGARLDCDYSQTLETICVDAYEKGGNAIVITHMKQPGVVATCYRIWADVYKVPIANSEEKKRIRAAIYDSLMHTLVPEDANYSLIYVYRPNSYEVGGEFNLHMDNKKVASLSINDNNVIMVTKPGLVTLWTKVFYFEAVERLDVEMGKVYFLRCHLYRYGNVLRPILGFVIPSKGFYDIGFKNLQEMVVDAANK